MAIGAFPEVSDACAMPENRVSTEFIGFSSRVNWLQRAEGGLSQYLKLHYGDNVVSIIAVSKPVIRIVTLLRAESAASAPVDVQWSNILIAKIIQANFENLYLKSLEIVSETTKESLPEYGNPGIYQVAAFTMSHNWISALSIRYRRQDDSVLHAILQVGDNAFPDRTHCLVASSPKLAGPGIC